MTMTLMQLAAIWFHKPLQREIILRNIRRKAQCK